MAYRNQQAQELMQRWQSWLKTRNRYVPVPQDSVLATMMATPRKRRPNEPDWDNDAEASYFHLAVMSLPESRRLCLMKVYGDFVQLDKPVKYWCGYLGDINRDTFYKWAHEAAAQAVIRARRMQTECRIISDNLNPTNEGRSITI